MGKQSKTDNGRAKKSWDESFRDLKAFKREHGHCNVRKHDKRYGNLGKWILMQRSRYRNGAPRTRISPLSPEQIASLNSIDFPWTGNVKENAWMERFERLKKFKQVHGHCVVPKEFEEDRELGLWVASQRVASNRGKLRLDRRKLLDTVEFDWAPAKHINESRSGLLWERSSAVWEKRFQELKEFREAHGHCRVPPKSKAKGTPLSRLSNWVSTQRQRRFPTPGSTNAIRQMSQQEIDRLDEIGFIWKAANYDERWNDKFERLKLYKREHGDCLVPLKYELDLELGKWVSTQRRLYKLGKVCPDRVSRLEQIGFVWRAGKEWSIDRDSTAADEKWGRMYEELRAFESENGHCLVPLLYEKDRSLGTWVATQRANLKRGTLSNERRELLQNLGFVWEVDYFDAKASLTQREWDKKFQKLLQFKEKYGHCRVPIRYQEDPTFGSWVRSQRGEFSSGTLNEARRAKLDSVGFVWNALKTEKKEPKTDDIELGDTSKDKDQRLAVPPAGKRRAKRKKAESDLEESSDDEVIPTRPAIKRRHTRRGL